jgi:hypothetical protein
MEPLTIIGGLILGGWLLARRAGREDRLVNEAAKPEREKTAVIRQRDEEKQATERQIQQAMEQEAREEIARIRDALLVPAKQIEADFARMFAGEELAYAKRAWSSYIHQSRSGPHKNKFKFPKVERFGNPATAEEARMAAERVRIAAQTAVIAKCMERRRHGYL